MATDRPSPNHSERRGGLLPRLVVLHYTAMTSAEAALQRLCDPATEVSAHWLVGRDGRVWRLVDESRRAWHAGAGRWGGVGDVNSASIGIEIDNDGASPFAAPAMAALEVLLAGVMARWSIAPAAGDRPFRHGAHAQVRPRAAVRLAAAGARRAGGLARAGAGPIRSASSTMRQAFGWPVEAGLAPVLAALRLRFRPGAEGPLDADRRRHRRRSGAAVPG